MQGITQILKQWIWLATHHTTTALPITLQAAWAQGHRQLVRAKRPWAVVKGPITATIAHLLQMGVLPIGPLTWGINGKETQVGAGPPGVVLLELEQIRIRQLWQ